MLPSYLLLPLLAASAHAGAIKSTATTNTPAITTKAATTGSAKAPKPRPVTVTDTKSAIAGVVSSMMSQSPTTKAATSKAAGKSGSAKQVTTTTTKKIVTSARTTTAAHPNITKKAVLEKRTAVTSSISGSTLSAFAACGVGSPVSATYNCVAGYGCVYSNDYYYQCLSTSSVGITSNSASTIAAFGNCAVGSPATATYACAYGYSCSSSNAYYYQCVTSTVPITKNSATTMSGYGACGVGSPVTATYDCVNGWGCSSSNAYYYQCLTASSSSAPSSSTTTVAASTTTSAAAKVVTTAAAVVNSAAAAQITSSTTTVTTSTVDPNAACATQPSTGYGFLPSDNSFSGFLNETTFAATALAATVPTGYGWVYAGFYASLNQAGYLNWIPVSTYNPATCATYCNTLAGCKGFAIYYERTPSLQPAAACPNPSMMTAIRCAFYSQPVTSGAATNVGQWRSSFAVVLAGGNGYNKL